MLPSANDLVYFQKIAQTLNISKAAQALGISQPSLSLSIKRLEENIGAELLLREKRGVKLTRAGKSLFVGTKDLLEQWEEIALNAKDLKHEVKGKYQIGCHPSVALYSLQHFLPELVKSYPHLQINFIHDLSRVILDRIVNHETDIGLVINPVPHPDLIITPLFKDEVSLWKHKDFKLNKDSKIICDTSLTQTQTLLKKLKKLNLDANNIMASNNLEVIRSMVVNKIGIGILPSRVANNAKNNLVKIEQTPIFKDQLCLVNHLQTKNLKAIEVIKKMIKEKMPAE
jgi:DNA-binding transcriptional LysR family regulator